jgi:hypothetical protein
MLPIAVLALGMTAPPYDIPRAIATRLVSGQALRIVVVGDSISTATRGMYWPDGTSRTHFPLPVGFAQVWEPVHGWRGIYAPPAVGTYTTARGVESWGWGQQLGPRVSGPDFPNSRIGQAIDSCVVGDIRSTLFTNTNLHASPVSQAIGQGDLRVRHIVYGSSVITATRTGAPSIVLNPQGDAWTYEDFPASPPNSTWNPELSPFTSTVTGGAIHAGTYFYDANSDGLSIVSVAQGGDNTLDHLRTSLTFGQPNWYATRDRGYHDDGLLSWLQAVECDENVMVMITLGTNIAYPDNGSALTVESQNGLSTQAFTTNVQAIISRWRNLLEPDPTFMLVAMYPFGPDGSVFATSRAERLWDVKLQDPNPETISYINLPLLMNPFLPSWWLSSSDFHLASLGAQAAAEVMWTAAISSTCPADFNLDMILNNEDFFAYLTAFAGGDPRADLTTSVSGPHTPNGVINNEDFFYFLSLFAQGC